jgi:hypothetical protein
MPAEVLRLPVRRRPAAPPPAPVTYEVEAVDGSVKVVIGEVEIWFSAADAERFGCDVATVGAAARESAGETHV